MNTPNEVKEKPEREKTKPVEAWTFMATVCLIVGSTAKFVLTEWPNSQLEKRQKEVAVAKAESEIVSVNGQWLAPEVYSQFHDTWIHVSPVFIDIHNHGEIPIEVKSVEFRIFTASFEDVIVRNRASEEKRAELHSTDNQENRNEAVVDRNLPYGFIDPDSMEWHEQSRLDLTRIAGLIPPGQQRTERRHVIADTDDPNVLTKVEVSVVTKNGTYRWYGFSPTSNVVCRAVPFSAGISDLAPVEVVPEPAPPATAE